MGIRAHVRKSARVNEPQGDAGSSIREYVFDGVLSNQAQVDAWMNEMKGIRGYIEGAFMVPTAGSVTKGRNTSLKEKKANAPDGQHWVTIRGSHVLVDGKGNIVGGAVPRWLHGKSVESHGHHIGKKESSSSGDDWKSKTKTPFDTEEVVKQREKMKKFHSTHLLTGHKREKMRDRIVDKLYGDGAKQKNREVWIITGPPAAGKSSVFADSLQQEHGALLVDSDEAKKELPEFNGGKGAGVVHEESSEINSRLLERAAENGDNIVLPIVGKSADSIQKYVDKLKSMDYKVHLRYNHLPKEETVNRAIARWHHTGRFVDPDYVYNGVGDKPYHAYKEMLKRGGLDSYEAYHNNVKQGEKPVLIHRQVPGKAAYDRLHEFAPGGREGGQEALGRSGQSSRAVQGEEVKRRVAVGKSQSQDEDGDNDKIVKKARQDPGAQYKNPDGTFKGGFDGAVKYFMAQGHDKESAEKIAGKIAKEVGKSFMAMKSRESETAGESDDYP